MACRLSRAYTSRPWIHIAISRSRCSRYLSNTTRDSAAAHQHVPYRELSDEALASLANERIHQLTLADLVKHGRPPLSSEALLSSANFTSKLIPVRLAHRVRALRDLPFIVASNSNISRIYKNYLSSLQTLEPFHNHEFTTLDEEIQFTDALADLVQSHANTIPVLARGFLECRHRYISSDSVTHFLDEHLRARIGTRLIAEQHLALHLSSQPHGGPSASDASHDSYIGVIDTELRPASILSLCEAFVGELCELKYGVRPSVVVNGSPETTITQIPMHLEYILTELLKNAFRATIESGNESHPIEVTITVSRGDPNLAIEDGLGERKIGGGTCGPGDETLTMRIRDRGGGISPSISEDVWRYSFTTFKDGPRGSDLAGGMQNDALNALSASGSDTSTIAGLGYGLPLSRAYAEYFGGSIALESFWGWGTDVYLTLKGLSWN